MIKDEKSSSSRRTQNNYSTDFLTKKEDIPKQLDQLKLIKSWSMKKGERD